MPTLAFCLYRCTPHGGLERNALALAHAAAARGHAVTLYARRFEGPSPEGLTLRILPVRAWTNPGRDRAFARALAAELAARPPDAVVGFNRLPGLDVFYAADPCFAASRSGRAPWLPRDRQRAAFERALCRPGAETEVLVQCAREQALYREHHGTPEARLHLLPPGLRDEFLEPGPSAAPELRDELGIPRQARVVLALGSDFARKGLDRTLLALARLAPALRARTWLVVVGAGRPARFLRLARRLGLAERLRFAGGRTEVLPFLRAADVLAHPAREENTGTVLLEAMSQGLVPLASAECGFAPLVRAAGAGRALASPFDQAELDACLAELLADDEARARLGARGREAARAYPMQGRTAAALAVVEGVLARRRARVAAVAT